MLEIRDYLFLVLMTVFRVAGNDIPMFGIEGSSVTLPCNVPIADQPIVEWSDIVWTSDTNPSLIFRSERNPQFEVHAFHENADNYVVDNDFALTIDRLDMEADPGQYTCRSVVDGSVFERHYYLTVGELPSCSGDVLLSEGQSTSLQCQMTYSGQQPLLHWFRGGQLVDSDDQYDIRLAKKVVFVDEATEDDDEAEYACRMSLGDMSRQCSLSLNVTYLVRDIKFVPEKEKFRVGDELKCSAKGNPVPRMSLTVVNHPLPPHPHSHPHHSHPHHDPHRKSAAAAAELAAKKKTGRGWQSVIIGPTWEGQTVTVQCTATNSIGGNTERETLQSNLTIHVTATKKHTTQTTSIPHEEDQKKRTAAVRLTTTTPLTVITRKEKEHSRPGGHHKKHHLTTVTPRLDTAAAASASGGGGGHQLVETGADDIEQHDSNRNAAVTYRVNSKRTDQPPVIKTMDAKERQRAKTEDSAPEYVTGTKPAQSKPNEAAGHMNLNRSTVVSTVVVLLVFRLILSHSILN